MEIFVVSLTAVTLYQLTADLLGIVIGHIIRGYSPRVWQPSARPICCGEQALPKAMPGLPAGSAGSRMHPAMTNAPASAPMSNLTQSF